MKLVEKNLLPEFLLRLTIRRMIHNNLKNDPKSLEEKQKTQMKLIDDLRNQPIAIETRKPNEQHYEIPSDFFKLILGKNMKYSCCYWENLKANIKSKKNLVKAEERMLEIYIKRAKLENGLDILDLGCGWGSLSFYLAKKFPNSTIWSLSNSSTQIQFIREEAEKRNLNNIKVIKADISKFDTDLKFDRIVSIEMFEHMRNYEKLLEKLITFLKENGYLFIHIFTRDELPYIFDDSKETSWMSKYFFTGGTMPSTNLLLYFNKNYKIINHWKVNGIHYRKTLNSWLWIMKKNKKKIIPILEKVYGKENVTKWWVFWKLFFIVNAEVFGWNAGLEWYVSHYLFKKTN